MVNPELIPATEEKQPRFFYGYIIILASFLILMITFGAQYSFGVFLKPVLNEFGWTREATAGAYSLNLVLGGTFGILAGRLCDRFGPRLVLTIGGLLIGLAYLLMSRVTEIWQIYLFYGVLLSIGQAGTYVPLMPTVARWFVRRRGFATGLVVAGIGVGTIITPPLANLMISTYNWQTSYIILGFVAMGLIGIVAQFLRRAPGRKNHLPQTADSLKTDISNVQTNGFSLGEAVRTRPFWIICVTYLFFGFGLHTVMVHIVAHATDIGISAVAAATILSVIGIVSIVSKLITGTLGDRIGNIYIIILVLILATVSFIWLRFASELWMLYVFAAVFGFSYGGFSTMQSPLLPDYFGLRSHGAIFGLAVFATTAGGALGSLVAGRIFDISGSYNWIFITCAVLAIASLILSLLLKSAPKFD